MQDAKYTQGAYNAMMAGLHCLHLEADAAVANDIQRLVREGFASVLAERDALREALKDAHPHIDDEAMRMHIGHVIFKATATESEGV